MTQAIICPYLAVSACGNASSIPLLGKRKICCRFAMLWSLTVVTQPAICLMCSLLMFEVYQQGLASAHDQGFLSVETIISSVVRCLPSESLA